MKMKNKIKMYKKRVFENSTAYTISIRYGVAHTSLQKNNITVAHCKQKENGKYGKYTINRGIKNTTWVLTRTICNNDRLRLKINIQL